MLTKSSAKFSKKKRKFGYNAQKNKIKNKNIDNFYKKGYNFYELGLRDQTESSILFGSNLGGAYTKILKNNWGIISKYS